MEGLIELIDSPLMPWIIGLVVACAAALMVLRIGFGQNPLLAVVPVLAIVVGALMLVPDQEPARKARWDAYSAQHCEQIEQKVVAGQEGQSIVGVAGTSNGAAPAVGFTSGTPDRVVTGWRCRDGRVYTTSGNLAPRDFKGEDSDPINPMSTGKAQ